MSTDEPSSVSIQSEASPIPSVPAWFGEVALVAHTLTAWAYLPQSRSVYASCANGSGPMR